MPKEYTLMGITFTDPARELRECERIMSNPEQYHPHERFEAQKFAELLREVFPELQEGNE